MVDDVSKNSEIEQLEKSINDQIQNYQSTKNTTTATEKSSEQYKDWWSTHDAMTISAAVLVFGCIIMVLATTLLYKGRSADDVLKLFGTVVIVIFAAFLVVAGYTDTQIAPVIGLLGTIAGYLLGSKDKDISDKDFEMMKVKKRMEEEKNK